MRIVMSEAIDYRFGPTEDVLYAREDIEVSGNVEKAEAWSERHKDANYALDDDLACVEMVDKTHVALAPRTIAGNHPYVLESVYQNYKNLYGRRSIEEFDVALRIFHEIMGPVFAGDSDLPRGAAAKLCMKRIGCGRPEFDRIFRAMDQFSACS